MHVWVLGAGFSVRLGGPLLRDLLHPSALSVLRVRHAGSWLDSKHNDLVVRVFAKGVDAKCWRDAEEFLAALYAYDPVYEQQAAKLLAEVATELNVTLEKREDESLEPLIGTATGLVAAQCHDFSQRIAHDREAWLPYARWLTAVDDTDVIVSFNYDTVVEQVFRRNARRIDVPNPRLLSGRYRPRPGCVRLLKLHGSVDFRDTSLRPPEPNSIANMLRNPAFIATPGMSKADMAETDFDDLWEDAAGALTTADGVSIIGYGCPVSDEQAKALLLDTLAANGKKPSVDVVLGPNGDASVVRLVSLLSHAGVKATDTRLWAEDYLSAKGVGAGWMPKHDDDDNESALAS